MFIDTHTHLTFSEFQNDIDDVVLRAYNAGINKLIVPGLSLKNSKEAITLAEKEPSVYAAVGVHPQESLQFNQGQIDDFYNIANHPKVVAIGEIGLDYFRDYAPRSVQQDVFRIFLSLACDLDLPIIIHNRSAFFDLFDILKNADFKNLSGVFHCFSEDAKTAAEVLKMGFVVSFTGTITFKNSTSALVAKKIPIEKQLLETDAPFMTPVPNRGKRNEPAFVKFTAEKLAELHDLSLDEVAKKTTDLALQLFPKLNCNHSQGKKLVF